MVHSVGETRGTTALWPGAEGDSRQRLQKACEEFESLLLQEIMKGMRRTISRSDLFPKGQGEEMFEELFDREICRSLSGRSGFGLAEVLYLKLGGATGTEDRG